VEPRLGKSLDPRKVFINEMSPATGAEMSPATGATTWLSDALARPADQLS